MRRIGHVVLVVVTLFVGLLVALLVAKGRTGPVEPASVSAPVPSQADLRIKEVEIEEQSGPVRWRLTAEQALVFERERRTSLRKVSVVVHDRERSWTIRGDEGEVREPAPRAHDVEVRQNVVVTSSDGYRLETTVLRWDGHGRRLWTEAPVRLTRAGTVIHGTAFELRMGDEATTVVGRVRATFPLGRDR